MSEVAMAKTPESSDSTKKSRFGSLVAKFRGFSKQRREVQSSVKMQAELSLPPAAKTPELSPKHTPADAPSDAASIYTTASASVSNAPSEEAIDAPAAKHQYDEIKASLLTAERARFALLVIQVKVFEEKMLRIHNANSLDNAPLGAVENAAVLGFELHILQDDRHERIRREVLGLGVGAHDSKWYGEVEIHLALQHRDDKLLEVVEFWIDRLNVLRREVLDRDQNGVVGFEVEDVRKIDGHKREARVLCDEILVARCNVEVRFREAKGTPGEECEVCNVDDERGKVGGEMRFGEEDIRRILEALRMER